MSLHWEMSLHVLFLKPCRILYQPWARKCDTREAAWLPRLGHRRQYCFHPAFSLSGCLPALGTWHQTVGRCSAYWPGNASSQQAASTTRPGWLSLARMTPVPRLQVLQLGPKQCGTVTSPPHCTLYEFLTHTNHDIMNDDGCLRPLDFWDNWLRSNRKRKYFVSKEHR